MRKLAFIITILGIFSLLVIQISLPYKQINSFSDLNSTTDNQKVFLSGQVIKEQASSKRTILTLDSNLKITCDCPPINFKGKNISVLGTINEFPPGNKQIEVQRIKIEK